MERKRVASRSIKEKGSVRLMYSCRKGGPSLKRSVTRLFSLGLREAREQARGKVSIATPWNLFHGRLGRIQEDRGNDEGNRLDEQNRALFRALHLFSSKDP